MTRVSAMVNSLAADMQQRFFSLLAEATLFDPKFNQKGFHNPAEADEAGKSVTATPAGSTQSSGKDDKRFMKLMDIMKRRLYIVANCAPAEKIFSKTWQIISERGTG